MTRLRNVCNWCCLFTFLDTGVVGGTGAAVGGRAQVVGDVVARSSEMFFGVANMEDDEGVGALCAVFFEGEARVFRSLTISWCCAIIKRLNRLCERCRTFLNLLRCGGGEGED